MAVIYPPESPMGIENAKWNKPYRFEPFPKMLYMAQKRPDGIYSTGETDDGLFKAIPGSAEQWTRSCQRTVKNENEERQALEVGWRPTQTEALDRLKAKEEYFSTAAAHRAYEDRNLSEPAKAEALAADNATPEHVAEVPEAPRVKRKYTRRATASA